MDILIEDFYKALMGAVKYSSPSAPECQRLKTFRVFPHRRLPDLTSENLGANICDKDKPFFWSLNWAESKSNPNNIAWAFPLLYAFDMAADIEGIFTGHPKAVHTIQIGVLDVLSTDCMDGKCKGCNGRTINEIHIDTERMLVNALRFTGEFVFGDDFGGAIPSGFYHEGYLEQLVLDSVIPPGNRTRRMLASSYPKNRHNTAIHVEMPTDRIYGTVTEFNLVTMACPTPANQFSDINWGVVPQNVGCENCE